jgi:hypothetical protein
MMVSTNAVRDAVVNTLHIAFPNIRIFDERIKQGLNEPCFYVKVVDVAKMYKLNLQEYRTMLFDIHYFADTYEEAHNMGESLFNVFSDFDLNQSNLITSRQDYNIVDDVLHFFIEYKIH